MIHFVGAGSGAPDLITLRGKALIEQADLIIYAGSLVNPKLLSWAKPSCKIQDSSKMTLDEVIAELAAAQAQGKSCVRLHTGDPCLYGAVREQFDALTALGIDFDICPGVSSFCAAAAALKTEYTLPGVTQSVIITRMAGRTSVPGRERIEALAHHGATMVIFLSASAVNELAARLIDGGCPPDMPAAVVYKASWPEEKILRGSLSGIAAMVEAEGVSKTALIIIGNCLGSDYELSKLYSADFSTQYRSARTEQQQKSTV